MLRFAKVVVLVRSCARWIRPYAVAIAMLVAFNQFVLPVIHAGDQTSKDEQDAIRRMNEQIQELQAKVKELETRLNEVTGAGLRGTLQGTATANAPSHEATPPISPSAEQESKETSSAPSVKLRMFGDLGYEASTQKENTNSFHIGTLDLLLTGVLTNRVSVLGEVLFIPLTDNHIEADVERLLLQYRHNEYFNFGIGRYHSSIGYYNTAFHQGAWFQTAIDRPFMYAFDDEGGFLPLQEVGISINGQIPSGRIGLNYVAEIGNGRAHLLGSDPAQNFEDTNNGKSVNFGLYSRPGWLPGLQTGFSVYHDHLTFSDNINHDELISTVYAVFNNSNYEFLNEGMLVRHTKSSLGAPGVFHTPGFYTQFSRRFGKYRPYFRYSYLNAGVTEPIYGDPADGPVVGRRNGPSLGLRYDMNDHAAFKLQYDHLAQRGQTSFNALEAQFSFAF
ncbi:MAG TPA: hypothetical protein VFI38_05825 [Candidatus Acidoferrum sp.]|nr:hypothetical protein [Candidatus Acidoferrum sp.]